MPGTAQTVAGNAAQTGVPAATLLGHAGDAWPLVIPELRRLDALDSLEVVGTPPEPEFDRVAHLAARLLHTPVALVCLVDEHRLWFKARVGTDLEGQPRAGTFCDRAIMSPGVTVVADAAADPSFAAGGGGGLPGPAHRFYAGAPLVSPDGERVGLLCVMDGHSRHDFHEGDQAALADLAAIVSRQLEQRRRVITLDRANGRTARTDAIMRAIADAATCEQALSGMLARLCDDHAAAAGYIWRLARPDHVLHEVSRNPGNHVVMDAHFSLARTLGIQPGNSLAADAIMSGMPRAVRFAGVADLHRYPMVASAMRHGLKCQVIQPIQVAGERFAVTLSFDVDRSDLDVVLADVGSLVDTMRPALYRKVAEERMHLLSTALDRANDAVMITEALPHDRTGPRIVYVNASFCRATGYALTEVVGQSPRLLLPPDAAPQVTDGFTRALQGWTTARTEVEHRRKDGTRYWVEMDVTPLADEDGWQSQWISIQRDITARRVADLARKERDASNRTLFEQSPMPTLVFDRSSLRFLDVNGAAVRQYGWTRRQFLTMSLTDVQVMDEQPAFGTLIAGNQDTEIARRSWTHLRADGGRIQVTVASHALTYAGEDAIMAVLQDVTEVEAARRAMQDANLRLADMAAQLHARTAELMDAHRLARIGTWRRKLGADRMSLSDEATWSDEMHEIMGFPVPAGAPLHDALMARIPPEDHPAVRAVLTAAAAQRVEGQVDFRIRLPEGTTRHCRLDARPVLDAAGNVTGLYGFCQDITAQKQTELALLRSEKLKSVGQLTGGVAHDFNNLLTVVTLNLEEALDTLGTGDSLHDILQPALHAAMRGAELTQQLLSYARRATLRPEQVRLSSFFRNLQPLLTRTIGKRYDLRLDLDHDGSAFVDPAQLENAIINLVINARDAMPDGGGIRVGTSLADVAVAMGRDPAAPGIRAPDIRAQGGDTSGGDVPDDLAPGRYLVVCVADTGTGIPADVLPRVFEPFFTTKDVGRGSGLGLSMVYGFAKQSGGQATITSASGRGTAVRLFLPVGSDAAAPALPAPAWREGLRALLVDDEPDVLLAASRMLSGIGMHVTTAATAAEAVAQLDAPGGFDLLISDVRLPGPVDGLQLAEEARARGVGVLLTSGYTGHSHAAMEAVSGGWRGGVRFLPKPYSRQALQDALSAVLDAGMLDAGMPGDGGVR